MYTRRHTAGMLASLGLNALAVPKGFGQAAKMASVDRLIRQGIRVREIDLNGLWQAGLARTYDRVLTVPGMATDPSKPTPGTLWYKRAVDIPEGQWTHATLTLNGARFAPEVYVNGEKVSVKEGGMVATRHRFKLPKGGSLMLEVALKSLTDLDPKDASAVPGADRWRSNISSHLWDKVTLRLHGDGDIVRILPASDMINDAVSLHWQIEAAPKSGTHLVFKLLDASAKVVVESAPETVTTVQGKTVLALKGRITSWSPETPDLYRLRAELSVDGKVVDVSEQNFGQREFAVEGLGIRSNGAPCHVRLGTVVWHRWVRDPEAKDIAFDTVWFETNVVRRLKDLGANGLRFHLGLPPEALLDLCDRYGLFVQMEWSFFHGIAASQASMHSQWRDWLDMAARHPSVVIVQPWNETGGKELETARAALYPLLAQSPPVVMNHRELTPVHKYWWSLFENLGLYYDSPSQFSQAVMVDEFGGNYLDGKGNSGGYPTTKESILRFLGRDSTVEERLQLHADSNARVAEYWRRLGVAGFSPFTILGSPEDGSHWYMGRTDIAAPKPKPVWQALSAAFAPVSLSLEIWNRNFAPSERVRIPLHGFNDSKAAHTLIASVHIVDKPTGADAAPPVMAEMTLSPLTQTFTHIEVVMPQGVGEWRIEARLKSPQSPAGIPIVSAWDIRTHVPKVPARVQTLTVGVLPEDTQMRAVLKGLNIKVVAPDNRKAELLLGGKITWQALQTAAARDLFDKRLMSGVAVVLTDAGPQPLGVGYSAKGLGGPLESAPTVSNPARLSETELFGGVKVAFTETAEPESALHPALDNRQLWEGLPKAGTRLWNGLRGGLIVPAADMNVTGLSGKALLSVWAARGADTQKIASGDYFAYELAGYYAYAATGSDRAVSDALRQRVKFLVEDAPALELVVNPNAPITVINLHDQYRQGDTGGKAESLTPLANAGKNLSRTPVVKLQFGPTAGQLVISQLITSGRLTPGYAETGPIKDRPEVYALRYDPVAVQFLLNMMAEAL